MPGPKTHDIFYKELKKKLDRETLNEYPNYDSYSLFAQGHDFLIYYNFYKIWAQKRLEQNIDASVLLQETKFQEFVYNYLKEAQINGSIEEEQVRLFIGVGYVMHHLLDAYTHPFIIYYAGDHTPIPEYKTWNHGCIETLLDLYMMHEFESQEKKQYIAYKDFHVNRNLVSKNLIRTLNDSLKSTYNMENGGEIFKIAFFQLENYMRICKCDYTGIKRILFNQLDHIKKGPSSFSYHRDFKLAYPYLNLEHDKWLNPYEPTIACYSSFIDLYNKALTDGANIINQLEKICQNGVIYKDDIYDLIPDISSVTGLSCDHDTKILQKKQWKERPMFF